MAKLVIYTKQAEAHPTDATINVGQFQPGDVISILDDGADFGTSDLGDWNTVAYCPGLSVDDLSHLMSSQSVQTTSVIGSETVTNNTLKRLRMWNCSDLAGLQASYGTAPVVPSKVLSVKGGFSSQNLSASIDPMTFTTTYFTQVAAIPDPAVIG